MSGRSDGYAICIPVANCNDMTSALHSSLFFDNECFSLCFFLYVWTFINIVPYMSIRFPCHVISISLPCPLAFSYHVNLLFTARSVRNFPTMSINISLPCPLTFRHHISNISLSYHYQGILAGFMQCVTPGHTNIRFVVSVDDLFFMFEYCNNMV